MSEEQAQALMQQLQAMESYLTDLVQREETVMRLLQEAASAVESMKGINAPDALARHSPPIKFCQVRGSAFAADVSFADVVVAISSLSIALRRCAAMLLQCASTRQNARAVLVSLARGHTSIV